MTENQKAALELFKFITGTDGKDMEVTFMTVPPELKSKVNEKKGEDKDRILTHTPDELEAIKRGNIQDYISARHEDLGVAFTKSDWEAFQYLANPRFDEVKKYITEPNNEDYYLWWLRVLEFGGHYGEHSMPVRDELSKAIAHITTKAAMFDMWCFLKQESEDLVKIAELETEMLNFK